MGRKISIFAVIFACCLFAFWIHAFVPTLGAQQKQSANTTEKGEIKPKFVFKAKFDLPPMIFEAETETHVRIYLCSSGGLIEPLTNRYVSKYPSFSMDKQFVLYQDREDAPFRFIEDPQKKKNPQEMDPAFLFQIYKLNMKTMKSERISDGSALDSFPVVSPVENRVAFCAKYLNPQTKWRIEIMDFDGKNRVVLDEDNQNTQLFPTWSPDGKKIAYISKEMFFDEKEQKMNAITKLVVRDLEKKKTLALPTKGALVDSAIWAPAGNQIAFCVSDMEKGHTSIWKINADGTNMQQVTKGPYDFNPSWFPDGTKLIFSQSKKLNGLRHICMLDLASQKTTELIAAENASLDYPKVFDTKPGN